MSEPIRIVGAVADTESVTFYKEDGNILVIKQGDPRLVSLLNKVIPITSQGRVAVVSLDNFSVYSDFEKKTNGFVKFFKAAKSAVKSLFVEPEVQEITLPPEVPSQVASEKPVQSMYAPQATVTDPIMEQAEMVPKKVNKPTPVSKPIPNMEPVTSDDHGNDETIIAVIDGIHIPDIEKIKPYIIHALKTNSTEGVQNFLKRVASVINKRSHSITDLMRFMERGDLPIADDGSIIAYKKLYADGKKFVDPHSRKVTQQVGSYVCVDEKLVDPNRNNECSNGLHIGQRSYMGNFSGDSIFLVKLAPEDVITVPERDASKIRAMGYHIIFQLPEGGYSKVNNNNALTEDTSAKALLARAIKGDHAARLEEVRIHGQNGGGVKITPLVKDARIETELTKEDDAKANTIPDKEDMKANMTAAPFNPREINKKVNEAVKSNNVKLNQAELARVHYETVVNEDLLTKDRIEAAKAIVNMKKTSKKPYSKLGFNEAEEKNIISISKLEIIDNPPTPEGEKVIEKALEQAPKKTKPSKSEPVKEISVVDAIVENRTPKEKEAADKRANRHNPYGETNSEKAKEYYKIMCDENHTVDYRKKAAESLQALKKKAKLSYERLGLLDNTQNRIEAILDPKFGEVVEEIKKKESKKPSKKK